MYIYIYVQKWLGKAQYEEYNMNIATLREALKNGRRKWPGCGRERAGHGREWPGGGFDVCVSGRFCSTCAKLAFFIFVCVKIESMQEFPPMAPSQVQHQREYEEYHSS